VYIYRYFTKRLLRCLQRCCVHCNKLGYLNQVVKKLIYTANIGTIRSCSVGVTTRVRAGCFGFRLRKEEEFFFSPKWPDRPWGTPSLLFSGYWGCLEGTKRPRREVNHSPSFSAEVENEWSYTFTSPTRFHGEDWDSFILFFKYRCIEMTPKLREFRSGNCIYQIKIHTEL
jgi:hypothetical protein